MVKRVRLQSLPKNCSVLVTTCANGSKCILQDCNYETNAREKDVVERVYRDVGGKAGERHLVELLTLGKKPGVVACAYADNGCSELIGSDTNNTVINSQKKTNCS